jgi:hypothetical protein
MPGLPAVNFRPGSEPLPASAAASSARPSAPCDRPRAFSIVSAMPPGLGLTPQCHQPELQTVPVFPADSRPSARSHACSPFARVSRRVRYLPVMGRRPRAELHSGAGRLRATDWMPPHVDRCAALHPGYAELGAASPGRRLLQSCAARQRRAALGTEDASRGLAPVLLGDSIRWNVPAQVGDGRQQARTGHGLARERRAQQPGR